jgi:hypothetical protein
MKENLINKSKQLEINFESKIVVKKECWDLNRSYAGQNEDVKVISITRISTQVEKSKEQELLNYILKNTKSF